MLAKLVNLFSLFSVLLRAGTLVFQSIILGGVLFGLWTARSSPELSPEGIDRIQTSTWRLLQLAAAGLAATQLFYLYVNSAVLMAVAEIPFPQVVGANFFISGCVVVVSACATLMVATPRHRFGKWLLVPLVAVILAASVMTNHAASRLTGRPLLIALSCIHELAVGFWIGGLPFLVLGLYRGQDPATRWYLTRRFSGTALMSVGGLVMSGAIMSAIYIGSWTAVLGTAYGVMVAAKVTMLGGLLLLGGLNFFLIRNARTEDALPRLRRLIEAELGIGITVILTAASLTSQPPAVDQTHETVTLSQVYHRIKPALPRFLYAYVPEPASGRLGPAKNGRIENRVLGYNVDGLALTPRVINDAIESESNHHWMGVVVLLMGVLALLARTGKVPFANYWPLLLIPVAVFIFVQADSECWPVGWKSFGACWIDPESFQHRIAALLCAGFGIFQLRVRKQLTENNPLAMVFPLILALGGAVLLTHSHAITNVKENTLVELSHVPMGVLAVFAGWAGWLELRLPKQDRTIPSLIWPLCFVLIGAFLLNYREM